MAGDFYLWVLSVWKQWAFVGVYGARARARARARVRGLSSPFVWKEMNR